MTALQAVAVRCYFCGSIIGWSLRRPPTILCARCGPPTGRQLERPLVEPDVRQDHRVDSMAGALTEAVPVTRKPR